MSLEFLRERGSRRLRTVSHELPPLLTAPEEVEEPDPARVVLDFEYPLDRWKPITVTAAARVPDESPQRFVDGCHQGDTVAWLQDTDGHPVPVRLAQIGGICLRLEGTALRRESAFVERVVSLVTDPFPAEEVQSFAADLQKHDFRLLPAQAPLISRKERGVTFDFERMSEQARVRTQHEMAVLEDRAMRDDPSVPTLIDGRLGRMVQTGLDDLPLVGVIKQQREPYLHAPGWRIFYKLEPGQRTPAFTLPSKNLPVVSWYLKLDGAGGHLPNWGVVRVEVAVRQFQQRGADFGYLDRLSRAIWDMRCRQGSYERAPVSLEPIVRAEECLKALFCPPTTLAQRFFHITGL